MKTSISKLLFLGASLVLVASLAGCGQSSSNSSDSSDSTSSDPTSSNPSSTGGVETTYNIVGLNDLPFTNTSIDLFNDNEASAANRAIVINLMNSGLSSPIISGLANTVVLAQLTQNDASSSTKSRLTIGSGTADGLMHVSTTLSNITSVTVKCQAFYKFITYNSTYSCDLTSTVSLKAAGETAVSESLAETGGGASTEHTVSISFAHHQSSFDIVSSGRDTGGTASRVFVNEISITTTE